MKILLSIFTLTFLIMPAMAQDINMDELSERVNQQTMDAINERNQQRMTQEAQQDFDNSLACKANGGTYNRSTNVCSHPQGGSGAVSSCQERTETALGVCEQQRGSFFSQAKNMLGGISQMGLQNACSEWGKASVAINAGLSAFSAGCSKEYLSCRNACEEELSNAEAERVASGGSNPTVEAKISSIKTYMKKCGTLQQNLASAASGVDQLIAANQMAAQCQAMTGNSIAEMCAKDPSLAICMSQGPADCSDPNQAMTNTICICQVNPRDARCGLTAKGNNYNQSSTGAGSGVDNLDVGSFGSGALGGGEGYSDLSFGKPGAPSDSNLLQGGSGGKGGIGSGGAGQGGPDMGGGRGSTGQTTKILNGYYGGKSGTAGAGGSGAGRGYGAPAGSGSGAGAGGNANVDLRQFMPGGKMDPQRGLAGVSGPDGITGPHTDIWKKVNKRYFAVSPSLLP